MKSNGYKLLCCALIGCLALLLTAMGFAQKPPDKPDPAAMEQHLKNQLAPFVDNQTITASQAEKILAMFRQKDAERRTERENIQQLAPADRDAYLQKSCLQRCNQQPPDLIKDLTETAGLSPEQAKIVSEALRPPRPMSPPFGKDKAKGPETPDPSPMEQHLRTQLDKLTMANTISSEQADKIVQFFRQKGEERKAEHEKIQQMKPDERASYMQRNCLKRCVQAPNPIKELMDKVGLTTEQAEAVADALRPPHHPAPPDGKRCLPPPPAPGE